MKKFSVILCLVFVAIMVFALPVSAATPYQTYTYSINGTALYSPDAYAPAKTVDSTYIGLFDKEVMAKMYPDLTADELKTKMVAFENSSDLQCDDLGNVYIADTKNNRILVLDRYYKLSMIIETFANENGVKDSLANPAGVFVSPDKVVEGKVVPGKIYVCDTDNSRIVTFDRSGNFLSIIGAPESEMIESSSVYKPVAVAVDKYDRLYVISSTTYQGVIVMTDEGVFTQYIGAPKVVISAWEIIWRRFQTDEQKARSEQNTSVEFNNIDINENGHIYVTMVPDTKDEGAFQSAITGKSKSGDYAPVRLLNAAGDEIMQRNGFYPPSGEVDMSGSSRDAIRGISTVVDVAVGPHNTWSIIDQKRSRVFTYDTQGNLLFAFGDTGRQLGNISANGLAAVCYQDNNLLMLDRASKTFTVYQLTEYGEILHNALRHTNERQYDRAVEDWTEILKRNSNFDAAYIGIGNALYRDGQYTEAIEYYQAAYDTSNYSNAYKELRKEWISKYILLIPIFVVAVCLICSKFMKYANKVNRRVATSGEKRTYGKELLYAFHVIFHPFDGFWDLKHEKRGSVRAAVTILGVTVLVFYYNAIGQGYIMNPTGNYAFIFTVALSVLVPFFLFITANWCLTTLFEGEGSFKDIFIAVAYSLTPFALILVPVTIATHVVISAETDILTLLITISVIWMVLLVVCGVMVTHDYTFGKNLITVLGTLLGMIAIMFIAVLFSTLLTKLVGFVINIVDEIQYRM